MGIEFKVYQENIKTGEQEIFVNSGKAYNIITATSKILGDNAPEAFKVGCGYVEINKEQYIKIIDFMIKNINNDDFTNSYKYRINNDIIDLVIALSKINFNKENCKLYFEAMP